MATFVLIPGAGSTAEFWHYLIPELERGGHRAIAVDLDQSDPGSGLSEYAERVVRAMSGHHDVLLVAQSLGGFTAPLVAERAPVRMIVLLNAMIPIPGERAADWWDHTGSGDARRAADAAAGRSGEFDMETHFFHDLCDEARAVLMAHAPSEPSDKVFEQPCDFAAWPDVPTKVVIGSDDRFFPADFQRRVAKDRLGLDADEIPGGHLVAISNAPALAERLDAYTVELVPR